MNCVFIYKDFSTNIIPAISLEVETGESKDMSSNAGTTAGTSGSWFNMQETPESGLQDTSPTPVLQSMCLCVTH